MSDTSEVLAALSDASARGQPTALATIVGVTGSTYRREGARMLVRAADAGPSVGAVSGGCLERDVERLARQVMADGSPRLVQFDLTAEDEAVWGWGLGCNGAIELLIEPGDRAATVAATMRAAIEAESTLAAVVVLDPGDAPVDVGARLVVHPDGHVEGSLGDAEIDQAGVGAARDALAAHRPARASGPAGAELFVDVLTPPPRLVVCGAGHDAIPMVDAAAAVGWRTVVVDERAALLTRERFPRADRLEPLDRPGEAAARVEPDERTSVIVMSHQYLQDLEYLRVFAPVPRAYLGLLGPTRRRDRLVDDLASQGVDVDVARLHAPAGLDIGAEGPEQIAAAVIAEALAVHHDRPGTPLRNRQAPIHDRPSRAASAPAT